MEIKPKVTLVRNAMRLMKLKLETNPNLRFCQTSWECKKEMFELEVLNMLGIATVTIIQNYSRLIVFKAIQL